MTIALSNPDDDPSEHSEVEQALADTIKQYRLYLQPGEGKPEAARHAALWLSGWRYPSAPLPSVQVGTLDQILDEAKRSLQVDSSGQKLTPSESLEKQRELLAEIVQHLVGQREDAQRKEAEALVHQRRSLRIAAWSLSVAALALLPPTVEIVLKLLGMDL
ncbi:hypothetical protein [Nocardiopsis changdeensis]|uniref:hypothetical protein n=1 Tax=Nocardiopsis changdeensis TaxID=2831969 RepID=UPI003F464EFA